MEELDYSEVPQAIKNFTQELSKILERKNELEVLLERVNDEQKRNELLKEQYRTLFEYFKITIYIKNRGQDISYDYINDLAQEFKDVEAELKESDKILKPTIYELCVHGSSSGNPGPSAAVCYIYEDGICIAHEELFIGNATCGMAKNIAIILGFIYLRKNKLVGNVIIKCNDPVNVDSFDYIRTMPMEQLLEHATNERDERKERIKKMLSEVASGFYIRSEVYTGYKCEVIKERARRLSRCSTAGSYEYMSEFIKYGLELPFTSCN